MPLTMSQTYKSPLGAFVYVSDEINAPLQWRGFISTAHFREQPISIGRGTFQSLVSGTYQIEVSKDGILRPPDCSIK